MSLGACNVQSASHLAETAVETLTNISHKIVPWSCFNFLYRLEGSTMRPILCAAVAVAIALLHIPTAYSLSCPPCALSVCETPKCCESGSFVKVRIMFTDFREQENKFNTRTRAAVATCARRTWRRGAAVRGTRRASANTSTPAIGAATSARPYPARNAYFPSHTK